MEVLAVDPNGVYTSKEVAKILKVSTVTFKRWKADGIIKANKIGGVYRVKGSEILRLLGE